jgi:ribonuclease E
VDAPEAASSEPRPRSSSRSPRAEADGSTEHGSSSTPRTRSRGGQGQGARGGPSGARTGDAKAAKTEDDAIADAASGETTGGTGEDGTPSTAPRKRRRRGGRGRGRSSGGSGGNASGDVSDADTDDAGADDEADVRETVATQRDDATPDAPASGEGTGGRRRGSRGRGSGASSAGAANEARTTDRSADRPARDKTTDKAGADKGGNGRAKAKSMTIEEQVAAGGPTRSIRNTRSRTGRSGSREGGRGRRREPLVTPPRITDKLMVITEHGERDQIAVLEENQLVQHYVTRTGATSMVGNVYLGRVQNVLPGMEAAFVDVGRGRNGVLYAGEVNYTPEDLEGPAPRIEQVLKAGQAVLVQVTKDPMGGKGARLTAQISLPGRFVVFAPNQSLSGISRRLGDNERKRLKTIMRKIKPEEHGVIVRTAAEGASDEALTHDLQRLIRQWDDIQREAKKVKAPAVVYEEPELTVRVVRDLFTDEEYRELVTDSRRIYDKVMAYVGDIAPDLAPKIKFHDGKLPAFEEHRIEEQIHKALDRKVWLPSGGYLIIERTEAMTIVDVNTGKSVGKTNLEETVVNTNLEAAREVARQLRLRDIGGIIVVDFIDMLLEKNKSQVEDTMKEAMALDKTRSQVFEIGPLGLLQVTRKRVSSGLVESFSETCPTCEGRGILLNYEA